MREIITLQIRGCGNNVGTKFWEILNKRANLDLDGNFIDNLEHDFESLLVNYEINSKNQFIPRTILYDSGYENNINLQSKQGKNILELSPIIQKYVKPEKNYAKVLNNSSTSLNYILNLLREKLENCDYCQGFQIFHSFGGSTGSGIVNLLTKKLKEEIPEKKIMTFSIFPDYEYKKNLLEIYNTSLSFYDILENTDIINVIGNEALRQIGISNFNSNDPVIENLNSLISESIEGITSTFRFHGNMNSTITKFASNLIPYPRTHCLLIGHGALHKFPEELTEKMLFSEIILNMFSGKNNISYQRSDIGQILSSCCIFKGNFSEMEKNTEINKFLSTHQSMFFPWIPENLKSEIIGNKNKKDTHSAFSVYNCTSFHEFLSKISNIFDTHLQNKDLVNLYLNEGLDEMDFVEASSHLNDIINEYNYSDPPGIIEKGELEETEKDN